MTQRHALRRTPEALGRRLVQSFRRLGLVTGLALIGPMVGIGWSSVAHATTAAERLSLEELTERSDLVVHGTVGSIDFEFVPEKGPFTRVQIELDEVIAGVAATETVTVRMYGGVYGDRRTAMDGAPCLDTGEEVVLFLVANGPDTFNVVNLAEGKFTVDRSSGTAEILERDLSGIVYIDPTFEPRIPTTLDALAAVVRDAAK